MHVRGAKDRLQKERERGQVLVLVALLLPVFLGIGSIVIDVGNWYVLKRHLQTQVDAAALAGGPAFVGCFHDSGATTPAIQQQALAYAGDPTRDPAGHNPLMEDTADVHAVLNSTTYWSQGDLPGATDWTAGTPCDTKFLDVKATDHDAPLLWKWIPAYPDLKTRARVEVSRIESTNGIRPLGVTEGVVEERKHRPPTDPPILLRLWQDSPNSHALRCDDPGASSWNEAMINGCKTSYQVHDASKHDPLDHDYPCDDLPAGEALDCIDSKPGKFQDNDLTGIIDCTDDPNLWNPMTVPPAPLDSRRWMPLFIVNDGAFTSPSDKTYQVKGWAMFYVTAMSGLDCPGDVPDLDKKSDREIWGHFYSIVTPGLGATVPSTTPCSFETDTFCVSNLVE